MGTKMRKLFDYFLIFVALIITLLFYFNFDLEGILWDRREQTVISTDQLKADTTVDYIGLTAGDDIPLLKTGQDWENVLNYSTYVTVVPVSIKKTNVYSLATWVGYFKKRSSGADGRRLAEAEKNIFDYSADYNPYYIIELQDGTRLLAQMTRGIAKQIENGKKVKLPLGQKVGITKTAKTLLKPICEKLDVTSEGVLYTIDNNWSSKNADNIMFGKYAIAFVGWILLSIILQTIADKIIPKHKEKYDI
ncbi:hypothetical protein SAMN02745136_02182 [Anaerocolumna jejuensis DSM 15929]|uniref:Uncharacterized protein n=1 Tax=Anaerocolumna jejuensis DSM 15929 TaxID=1121322 RepID=A0A1M6R7Z9_9FIRM|nr:hypothetical protein [Anaerocolumna jejuensis]SHK28583.1 hypothetical protein SAMN02745136_02182 [Anaerocolumna jejuensis DSM 15929]